MNSTAFTQSKVESHQVNESVATVRLKEQRNTRCLKAVPSEKERNEFFIGVNSNKNSEIILTCFDEKVKKITTSHTLNLDENIVDIYPSLCNKNLLFSQTFNTTSNNYRMNLIKYNFSEGKFEVNEQLLKDESSHSIYEGKINPNNENIFYIIKNDELITYDVEKGQSSSLLKFKNEEKFDNNPIKIPCDITPEYVSQYKFAKGFNKTLTVYDLKSNEEISTLNKTHYNGILSVEFVPHTFTICTSGMDSSIKYWDTRNLSEPVYSIINNSHWVWSTKHNKVYNKIVITCSSSTLVKCYVYNKNDESNGFDFKPKNVISEIDYNEFDDSVYAIDWSNNDPWSFAAVSYNCFMHVNILPDNFRIQALLDK